jgi:hypothetical protein
VRQFLRQDLFYLLGEMNGYDRVRIPHFSPIQSGLLRELSGLERGINCVRWLQTRTAMKSLNATNFFAMVIFSAACLAAPGWARAQAPPGPLPATPSQDAPPPGAQAPVQKRVVQPRPSILGAWKLDPEDSDDPRKKMQQERSGGNNGGHGGNRRMGGGYPGGGYGGHRGVSQGESDEDRQRMQELFNPSHSLTIAQAQKDVEIDAFDDQERKRAFFTDGRKLQKSKGLNYQEIAAHWDANRLTTDEKNPRGGKMSRTFELSYDGTQLYETLHMTVGRSGTPLVIRYVYDQAPGSASPPAKGSSTPSSKQ